MSPPSAKPSRQSKVRSILAPVFLLLVLGIALAVIGLAMRTLPNLIVDSSAYTLPNGMPDRAAAQNAYNAARVPIGVTAAAVLAAMAAAAGVLMNARTVAVSRESLAQARVNDDERRQQWREEHLHSRFQDAAGQLGNKAASVRLAGVLSMARLADSWNDQQQACVDVLTAYYRMPLNQDDAAERQVRRVVLNEILRRLSIGARHSWSDCAIDLSGSFIEGMRHPGPIRIKYLNLASSTICDFAFLDQVQLDGLISLDKATIESSFRLLATTNDRASVWAIGARVAPGARLHVGLWRPEDVHRNESHPAFVRVNLNDLVVDRGRATFSLWGHFGENFLFGHNVSVVDGSLAMSTKEGSAVPGAFRLPGLSTAGSGQVAMNEAFHKCLSSAADKSADIAVVGDDSDLLFDDADPREAIFV